jgi:hypothetical protein
MAARVGLDARPVQRQVGFEPAETVTTPERTRAVTIVGERAFGAGSLALHEKAIASHVSRAPIWSASYSAKATAVGWG